MKFKVGDLIRGIEGNPYGLTNEHMKVGIVIEVFEEFESIRILIIYKEPAEWESYQVYSGFFDVSEQYFDFIDETDETTMKIVGTIKNSLFDVPCFQLYNQKFENIISYDFRNSTYYSEIYTCVNIAMYNKINKNKQINKQIESAYVYEDV